MNALIFDDEEYGVKNLQLLIKQFCPEVSHVFTATEPSEALAVLADNQIDVLLLDINMPLINGFDFIELNNITLPVIFITAFDHFAIKAFKIGAVDYILKPVSVIELRKAIAKVAEKSKNAPKDKLLLTHLSGMDIVGIDDVIMLEADDNITMVYTTENKYVVSKNLNEFEKILDKKIFVRVHKSFLINLYQVKKVSTSDGYELELTGSLKASVSRRNVKEFQDHLNRISLILKK